MAKTNFQIFNEENAPERTYNDSEYKEATQRVGGVMPGMALSRMHNKMYYQWSAMCKAIANLIVNHGHDCMDSDVDGITRYLEEAIVGAATTEITAHRTASELDHPEKSVHKKHLHQDAYESPALTGTPTAPTPPSGSNNTQLATTEFVALSKTGIVASNLAENGWVKFANGLIVQWGIVKNGNGTQRVSFPISFGSKVFHINFSSTIASNDAITNSAVQSYSLTGAELYGNTSPAGHILWFALGI